MKWGWLRKGRIETRWFILEYAVWPFARVIRLDSTGFRYQPVWTFLWKRKKKIVQMPEPPVGVYRFAVSGLEAYGIHVACGVDAGPHRAMLQVTKLLTEFGYVPKEGYTETVEKCECGCFACADCEGDGETVECYEGSKRVVDRDWMQIEWRDLFHEDDWDGPDQGEVEIALASAVTPAEYPFSKKVAGAWLPEQGVRDAG